MLVRVLIVGSCMALVAGCYDPTLLDCRVRCANPTDCAGEQVCDDQGWCVAPAMAGQCNAVQDATTADGAEDPIDARPSLCELGCPGSCEGDVCVIDCSAGGSCDTSDVVCPANLPCRVICGPNACTEKVICTLSTSCDIQCIGNNSCRDEIQCGAGPCDVACSGDNACAKRIKCKNACSCDVTCSGTGSCAETPECPGDMACRLGLGCTSQLAGCDDC